MIDGGYYIKARKIQESAIARAAPYVREIWDWLLKEANHKDTTVCNRGQTLRSFKDIQDGLAWFAGWRKHTYSKDQCEKAMAWLREAVMIATEKTTRGMLITIVNYDKYQNPENYGSDNESNKKATRKQQPAATINKNEKNDKETKNIYVPVEKNLDEEILNATAPSLLGKFKDYWNQEVVYQGQTMAYWQKIQKIKAFDVKKRLATFKRLEQEREWEKSQWKQKIPSETKEYKGREGVNSDPVSIKEIFGKRYESERIDT